MDGEDVIASSALPQTALGEAMIAVPGDDARELTAVLTGKDAIPADDRALVVVESGPAAIAVIGDSADDAVSTGGAPVVEQALAALNQGMAIRPIPQAPDRREDTQAFAAIIIDDQPGFTPEQRHVLGDFVYKRARRRARVGARPARGGGSARRDAGAVPRSRGRLRRIDVEERRNPASAGFLGEAAS